MYTGKKKESCVYKPQEDKKTRRQERETENLTVRTNCRAESCLNGLKAECEKKRRITTRRLHPSLVQGLEWVHPGDGDVVVVAVGAAGPGRSQ